MRQRVITAIVLIPLVLLALFAVSDYPIGALAAVVCALGATEICRMLQSKGQAVLAIVALAIFAAFLTSLFRMPEANVLLCVGIWLVGLLASYLHPRAKFLLPFSVGWVVGPMLALMLLHHVPFGSGWRFSTPVLLPIVPLWAGDTAAIFAGRAFGKHPLAPKISPKKTWEGGIANLLACIVAAIPLATALGYSLPVGLACGFAAGILGQAGDLFESFVKRRADLKDSGTLLPGHGGIMDRIDSILFTAPAVAFILSHMSLRG